MSTLEVSKSLPVTSIAAWELLFSIRGLKLWLGEIDKDEWKNGEAFETAEGNTGKLKFLRHLSHLRMSYQHKNWKNDTQLHVKVEGEGNSSTITFHQERLEPDQAKQIKTHWEQVLKEIALLV